MGAFSTQLPPDRRQWSLLILKQFYREHNYINPQVIKVILKDGASANDAGGIYFSRDGVSFIAPIIIHDGKLVSFDTFVTGDGRICPLSPYSFNQEMLNRIPMDGKPVRRKTVATSTTIRNNNTEGYGSDEPIVKTGAYVSRGMGAVKNMDKNGRLNWPNNDDIDTALATLADSPIFTEKAGEGMLKIAEVYRYGDLYDVNIIDEGRYTALTRGQAAAVLSLRGMELEKLGGRNAGVLSSAAEVVVDVLGEKKADPELVKTANYFFFNTMMIDEVSPIEAAYGLEKIGELKTNDLVGFFGNVGETAFFSEPIIVTEGTPDRFNGVTMSSTEHYLFKRAELLRYPVKRDGTVYIPQDWCLARVKPADRSLLKEGALEPDNLVKLSHDSRIWRLDRAGTRETVYRDADMEVKLAELGLDPDQLEAVMEGARNGKARFLVTPAAEIPKKKPVVPELDDVSLEEIKTAAYNAAVKLAADGSVPDATVRQILQIPSLTKSDHKTFVEYVKGLSDVKGFLTQYLLRYRIDAPAPDEGLIETVKDLIDNIERLEAAVYGE